MKHTRIMIMAAVVACMLALTGCGKGNQTDTSSTESTQPVTTAAESVTDAVTNDTTSSTEETTTETVSEPETETTASATEPETESEAEAPAEGKHLDISFSDIDAVINDLSATDINANDTVLRKMFDIDFDHTYEADEDEEDFKLITYEFNEPVYIKDLDLPITYAQTAVSEGHSSISIYIDVSNEGESQTVNSFEKIEKIEKCFFGHEDVYTPTGISESFEHISTDSGASFVSASGHSVDMGNVPTDPSKIFVTFSS